MNLAKIGTDFLLKKSTVFQQKPPCKAGRLVQAERKGKAAQLHLYQRYTGSQAGSCGTHRSDARGPLAFPLSRSQCQIPKRP